MLDWFFEGKISEEEMLKIKERYDSEMRIYDKQLRELQNEDEIINDKTAGITKQRDVIKESAVFSEEVYGEILDRIEVYDEYMIIRLKYLDFGFKIKYTTLGYKDKYTTVIESCERIEQLKGQSDMLV